MKTSQEVAHELRAGYGRYHEDVNDYKVLTEPKEYVQCDCCNGFIEVDEGEKVYRTDREDTYCEKCYQTYLEQEEYFVTSFIESEQKKIDKLQDSIRVTKERYDEFMNINNIINKAS